MSRCSEYSRSIIVALCLMILSSKVLAQDLDPRAYTKVPIDITFAVLGFGYSYGNVITDPTIAIQDLNAKIESPILGIGQTFSLFGLTSQAYVTLPYTWAQATGLALGDERSTTRSGLADMKFRLSVLLLGAPATTLTEFTKDPTKTIVLGLSLSIVAPTGQFFPDKIINIGTNRWSFKPELGLSYPVGKRTLIDLYTGIWLFTNNESFYPGSSVRSQNPLYVLQLDISYNVNPLMWAAIDVTYYIGGQSSINNVHNNDREDNVRVGATLNLPLNKKNSLKFAYSTGAIIRFGADFSTISVAWQTTVF